MFVYLEHHHPPKSFVREWECKGKQLKVQSNDDDERNAKMILKQLGLSLGTSRSGHKMVYPTRPQKDEGYSIPMLIFKSLKKT